MNPDDKAPRGPSLCAECGHRAVADTTPRRICLNCRSEPKSGALRIIAILLTGYLFWLLSLWKSGAGTSLLVANSCLGWLIMLLTVLPHEFAHALVARWLGLGIGTMHAGYGPLILRGRFLGFSFVWRAVPIGGHLELGQPVRPVTLPRLFAVYAAGPFSHLAMALAAWLLMTRPGLSAFNPLLRVEAGWMFIFANLFQFAWSITPVWRLEGRMLSVTDGLAMLQMLLFRRPPFVPQWNPRFAWTQLYAVTLVAGFVLLLFAIVRFRDTGGLHAAPWLYLAGSFACTILAATMQQPRHRQPGDGSSGNRTPDVHRQLTLAGRREVAAAVARLSSDDRACLEKCAQKNDPAESLATLERLAADYPDNFIFYHSIAEIHTAARDWPPALTAIAECLRYELPPAVYGDTLAKWFYVASMAGTLRPAEVRTRLADFRYTNPAPLVLCCVLDAAATRVLECRCPDLLPDAVEWTAEAMRLAPLEITLTGSRGGVLIETGAFEEGEILLHRVMAESTSDHDVAIGALYLAIAARHRRDNDEAATLASRARELLPAGTPFRERLDLEFPAAQTD